MLSFYNCLRVDQNVNVLETKANFASENSRWDVNKVNFRNGKDLPVLVALKLCIWAILKWEFVKFK